MESEKRLSDQAEAEDAVQDAFTRLWTHAAKWQPGKAKFATWLYRVTLNQCYDRLRRKQTAPIDDALDVPDPAIGFLQECVRWWDRWLKGKQTGVEKDPAIRLWLPPRPPLPVVEAPTAHENVRNEQDR